MAKNKNNKLSINEKIFDGLITSKDFQSFVLKIYSRTIFALLAFVRILYGIIAGDDNSLEIIKELPKWILCI